MGGVILLFSLLACRPASISSQATGAAPTATVRQSLLQIAPVHTIPPVTPLSDLSRYADGLFSAYTDSVEPGVAVMVIYRGAILHEAGYGLADLQHTAPIWPQSPFRLASLTKQFTAMGIMLLAEAHQLRYDDPITLYVPELSRIAGPVTILDLLHHTAGLPASHEELRDLYQLDTPTNADVLAALNRRPDLLSPPGVKFNYSNVGYGLLATIIERVSGQSYADYLQDHIFDPLGMALTVVDENTHPVIPERAIGYLPVTGGFTLNDHDTLDNIVGSDGVYSTLEDLYLWDQALYTDQLVSKATLARAFSPSATTKGAAIPYGFGWWLGTYQGAPFEYHSGAWLGFRTYIARYPQQQLTVILLSNRADFNPDNYGKLLADKYLKRLK